MLSLGIVHSVASRSLPKVRLVTGGTIRAYLVDGIPVCGIWPLLHLGLAPRPHDRIADAMWAYIPLSIGH
jgi:hypothetical protein